MKKRRPQSHFTRFKKSFLKWQKILNCMDYRVYFEFKDMGEEAEADIGYRAGSELWATIGLNTRVPDFPESPEQLAKHEAVHLLLAKFFELAERGSSRRRLREAEESVVRILEDLL